MAEETKLTHHECCGYVQATKFCGHCGNEMPEVHECQRCGNDGAIRRRVRVSNDYPSADRNALGRAQCSRPWLCEPCYTAAWNLFEDFLGGQS